MIRALAAPLALCGALALCSPAAAQQHGRQPTDEEETPTPAPLPLGSMAIASDAALRVDSMSVQVGVDRVTYAYRFENKGKARLDLAASVGFPDLEVSNEGTTVYVLPSQQADDVVGLAVSANGKPIATTPHVEALALGIDRLADLKAAGLPLIPFGEATDKALTALPPATMAKLQALGLVTPADPSQPDTPVIADWTLRVVHGWTQPLEPGAPTDVSVSFAPIKAVYTIDAATLPGFDALKEQVCLTPQLLAAAKAMLKTKGTTADVADIVLANDGPARWLDNPPPRVAVTKPTPDSLVAFCGVDPATQAAGTVRGTMAGSSQTGGLRVLIFTRNASPH